MYYSPGSPSQLAKWHKPLDFWPRRCHTTYIPKETHMETLDLATLELLAALEADLEVPDFDDDDDVYEWEQCLSYTGDDEA